MRKITRVTKRDIFDLFNDGINIFEGITRHYPYYGRLTEIDFLKRLYDLSNMESSNSSFQNVEEELSRYPYNRGYSGNWVFNDARFQLLDGDDDRLLQFLCEVFHPEVRNEQQSWSLFLDKINELLHADGYELYVSKKISGRNVYGWRPYTEKTSLFIPFSERNQSLIKNREIKITISNKARRQLLNVINEYNEIFSFTTESNWHYTKLISELVFEDISKFYIPKHFINKGKYIEIKNFDDFFYGTPPYTVFDVIELFGSYTPKIEQFEKEINTVFELNTISVEFRNYEIHLVSDSTIILDNAVEIKDTGLKDLLKTSEDLYNKKQYSDAVEKIWDAFERAKSYYMPCLDKKKSAEKIIENMSSGNENIKKMFHAEFIALTDIGNSYRIRHHEKNKIDISSDLHYEYFYKRCLSLLSVIIKIFQ